MSLQKRRVINLLDYLTASYVHNEMCVYKIIADWFVIPVPSKHSVWKHNYLTALSFIYNAQLSLYILISLNVCCCFFLCLQIR